MKKPATRPAPCYARPKKRSGLPLAADARDAQPVADRPLKRVFWIAGKHGNMKITARASQGLEQRRIATSAKSIRQRS
jgi:hypothetical protein